mmetsp:Transcript_1793/g.7411  ORF Transcript_1793/g.7411 Transcript_1793/m.7411 type:complete len:226 (+) Transcript_1793:969-1646(+)
MRCTQSLQNAWSHFFVSGSETRRLPSVTLADVAEGGANVGDANVGARPSQRRISLPGTSSAKHTPQKCVARAYRRARARASPRSTQTSASSGERDEGTPRERKEASASASSSSRASFLLTPPDHPSRASRRNSRGAPFPRSSLSRVNASRNARSLRYSTHSNTTGSPAPRSSQMRRRSSAHRSSAPRDAKNELSANAGGSAEGYALGKMTLRRTAGRDVTRPTGR